MLARGAVPVVVVLFAIAACSFVGKSQVRVETGNQPTGYLSRPMLMTVSSDESVQEVAQGICDNVKKGSTANVTFVGKIAGPDPLDFADWGRYRYVCESSAATPAVAVPAVAVPVVAVPAVAAPAVAASTPVETSAAVSARPSTDGVEKRDRDCLMQRGTYHLCLGNCMVNSSSPPAAVAAECQQRCAPNVTPACN